MTVAPYEPPAPLPASLPGDELEPGPRGWVARLRGAAEYAAYIADTEFVPDALRRRPAAIAAAILYGAEVGLDPMAALRSVVMIKGKPSLYAEAQVGLVHRAGHELWFEDTTSTRAIACGRRAGTDRIQRITWTMDDAKRAGLAGQANYRTYPAEMLRARASSALVRAMFSDVTLGIPAAEELEGEPDNGYQEGPPPTEPPAASPTPAAGRKRRRRAAPTPGPAAGPVEAPPPPEDQPEPGGATEPGWTEGQKRRMFALMRDVGFATEDRDARLAYASRIAGRKLASANELTIGEADRVNTDLEEILKLPANERLPRLLGADEAEVLAEAEALSAEGAEPLTPADRDEASHGLGEVDAAGDGDHVDDDIPF
jgi:hypothetical protein